MLQVPSRANIPPPPQEELLTDSGEGRDGVFVHLQRNQGWWVSVLVKYKSPLNPKRSNYRLVPLKLKDKEEANDRDCRGRTTARDMMTGKKTSGSTCADKSGMFSA